MGKKTAFKFRMTCYLYYFKLYYVHFYDCTFRPAGLAVFIFWIMSTPSISWKMNNRKIYKEDYYTSGHFIKVTYYINTNEIPSELSRENMISSQVKITCFLHK